ncbi:MAG: DUF3127 domain-containing protein [Prevotella sp.]|nr:DUF3127 domain-containing protein [Prevotella sp.]
MKRTIKIVRVGAEKKGVSQKTGMEWKLRDLDVAWEETGPNGEPYDQSANVQISGDTNEEALKYHMAQGTRLEARMYFKLSSYNDRSFTNIRCHLPQEANEIPTL